MPFKSKRTGKWVAKVVHQGTQHWIGEDYPTKTAAREAEDAKRLELKAPARPRSAVTCDEFATNWTRDYPRPKESTNRYNAERIRKFGLEHEGIPLASIDRVTARQWALRNPGHLQAVRAMYGDAFNDGLVTANPFAGLRLPQGRGRKDIVALTEPELTALADKALDVHGDYGPEFRSLILFAAHVGLRPGELMLMRWADIRGDYLHIGRRLDKYGAIDVPKNGKGRVVPIPAPAREALKAIPQRHADTIFRSLQGKRLTHGTLWYAWNKVVCAAGRPGLDFYEATRHYCATRLLEMGVSHADVAVQLGHEDGGALVMSTYGHPSKDDARKRLLAAYEQVAGSNVTPLRKVEEK